jgi:tetratricopeptide (TPR) repeat protein
MSAEIHERTQYDWFSIARIHETKGEYEDALKAYEQSIMLDNEYAKAWFYKSKVHYRLGQMKEARECVKKALELEPDWKKFVMKYMPKL